MKPKKQDMHIYEYAVIRVLPKVEREEFLNAGLIVFCNKAKYIKVKIHLDENKFNCFSCDIDIEFMKKNLDAFEKIANGGKEGGKIAELTPGERFRWLTAMRSSCIQTSRPHPGMSDDLDSTFDKLFEELVV